MFFIESERLRLIPLTHEHLLIYNDHELFAATLGINHHKIVMEELFENGFGEALGDFWLPKTKENPDAYQWFTNWLIVLKAENIAIGGIGLSGLPNEKNETETGYAIDKSYRNKGFTSEALTCLSKWTFQHPDLHALIAHTWLDGFASQKVLQKAGFKFVEQLVNHDGEVYKWRLEKFVS